MGAIAVKPSTATAAARAKLNRFINSPPIVMVVEQSMYAADLCTIAKVGIELRLQLRVSCGVPRGELLAHYGVRLSASRGERFQLKYEPRARNKALKPRRILRSSHESLADPSDRFCTPLLDITPFQLARSPKAEMSRGGAFGCSSARRSFCVSNGRVEARHCESKQHDETRRSFRLRATISRPRGSRGDHRRDRLGRIPARSESRTSRTAGGQGCTLSLVPPHA